MTEEHGVPDHRCGFELSLDDVDDWEDDTDGWDKTTEVVRCCRETWNDTKRCIWHAEVKNKPIEDLKAARADGPERLDGTYLVGVEANVDISFRGCGLRSAVFSGGDFSRVQFCDADLRDAQFHETSLSDARFSDADLCQAQFYDADARRAQFHNATLLRTEFHDATLRKAQFHDAFLGDAQFYDANVRYAQLHDAYLIGAQFHNAILIQTEFHNAILIRTEFHDANLHRVQFYDANLSEAEFQDADLTGADCTDANVRYANFAYAMLHDTLLTRTDCRGATFTNALLYETVFADTRINSQTTFHDPTTSRPIVVYEENPSTSEDLPGDTHPLEAAEWVYRRLEKLHDENALSEDARDFHISKEEAQRKYQRESGECARYVVSTLQWYVTGHGESIPRIFGSAAVLILISGILYPLVGGFESSSTGAAYRLTEIHQVVSFDGVATLLQGIYFSVITFTTIGYGDLYPTGVGSKLLVGFESLSGAILIALFVFVLGRRVAR